MRKKPILLAFALAAAIFAALLGVASAGSKSTSAVSTSTQGPDVPARTTVPGKKLRGVVLLGRHGNRAPDPSVKVLCPNRKVQSALYESQNCGPGSMTREGLRAIWDLGRATYRAYVQDAGLVPASYKRTDVYVQASSSDRTIMSAIAWGVTAFPETVQDAPYQVPPATYSVPMTEDNLLEVRKARCLGRLQQDIKEFDETVGKKIIENPEFNKLLDKVSGVCGVDLRKARELTDGEFGIFEAIKDVSDAITGDFLEGFPRMEGLTNETALEFLTMAENLFQNRLYGSPAQAAYLSGKLPEKIQNFFERHVITRSQALGLLAAEDEKEDISDFAKIRAPRKLTAYHCHREVLYGIAKFLGFNITVERPGLPTGLLHPGAGLFFELWEDDKVPAKGSGLNQISLESRFYVRTLLWVPCWEGDGFAQKTENGLVCPLRVRILPQCGEEFCPLPTFNEIIETNFQAVGGDFRKQCRVPALSAESLLRKQVRQLQSQIAAIEKQKALMVAKSDAPVLNARDRRRRARYALAKRLQTNRRATMKKNVRRPRTAKVAGSNVFLEETLIEDGHDDNLGLSTDAQDPDISFTPLRDSLHDMVAEHNELIEDAQKHADEDEAALAKASDALVVAAKHHKHKHKHHSQLTKEERDAIAASVKEALWEIRDSVLATLGAVKPSAQAVAINATTGAKDSAETVRDAAKSFAEEVFTQAKNIKQTANTTLEHIKSKAVKVHEQLKQAQEAHAAEKHEKTTSKGSVTLKQTSQDDAQKEAFMKSVPPQAAEFLKKFMKQNNKGSKPESADANSDPGAFFQSGQSGGDAKQPQQQQFTVPDISKYLESFTGGADGADDKSSDDSANDDSKEAQAIITKIGTQAKASKDEIAEDFKAKAEELKKTMKSKTEHIRDSIKKAIAKQKAKAQAALGSSAHKTKE